MASGVLERQKRATAFFVLGWALILINIGTVVLTTYAPFHLKAMTQEAFFWVDEGVKVSRMFFLVTTGLYIFALLQALFLGTFAHSVMKDDTPQVAAAEGSLKIARITAVVAMVLMFYGWYQTVRIDIFWHEALRQQQLRQSRDWGG
jgi:CBS domain containing-hemolysin-like protein